MSENIINASAMEILNRMALTPSGEDDRHLYPDSRQKTLQMKGLLEKAWACAEDREDPAFKDKFERLDGMVRWSLARHRTWSWPVLAGVLLFAALLLWGGLSNNDSIKIAKENIKTVEEWEPRDTTITWETCAYPSSDAESMAQWRRRMENANLYKKYHLGEARRRYLQNSETVESYRQKAEAETDQEKKSAYLRQVDYWTKTLDKYKGDFDELAPLDFKATQEYAAKQAKSSLSCIRSDRTVFLTIFLLVMILCALYIWTGNPHGYDITKSSTLHNILGWIRKVGLWFAGAAFGTGFASKLFADDIIWRYEDGHREREADVAGTAGNAVWKIILMVVGVIAFVAVSGIVMFIETAFALPTKLREAKDK